MVELLWFMLLIGIAMMASPLVITRLGRSSDFAEYVGMMGLIVACMAAVPLLLWAPLAPALHMFP